MLQILTDIKSKFSPNPVWQDFEQISDSFDLALSPEVLGWFEQQNGHTTARNKRINGAELDEYELSLS
ncbi:hypothetical protein [Methylomicrobium lacus]|uniref:hypothetical protein n=1 Tax=Methylomicrobium lacus TaxID=136992 RepID=UPI00045E6751|nr:hypothetical protein [Methylomicrobium lacus]